MRHIVRTFARLRWRLLRGSVRRGGAERFGALVATIASAIVGLAGAGFLLTVGRATDRPGEMAVLVCTAILSILISAGIITGISQPVDPRVIAAEPLTERERAVGVLAAAALGPPGLAGIAIGLGLAGGMIRGASSIPIVALAVLSWLCSLLLITRTMTNLLGLLINRLPRTGQFVAGLTGLAVFGGLQIAPVVLNDFDAGRRTEVADALDWTPTGQIGRALGAAGDDPLAALGHLALGSTWLPVAAAAFLWSTSRLAAAVRVDGRSRSMANAPWRRIVRRLCGSSAAGTIAWRSMLTRVRTPRTALETVTGAGVGLAAVIAPAIVRDGAGSGAVLVGGAVQLAVLFMSGNSFGVDGPALSHEILAGADPMSLAHGKARSIAIVAGPLAVIGPLVAAGLTGEWQYLPAGFCVGIAGLLAGSGAAVTQSALVPIAIPDNDDPFASGETGQGMIAALLLVAVLFVLAIATVPVALALLWALSRNDVVLVTALAIGGIVVGWLVYRLGIRLAVDRLQGRTPEFIAAVTPAR
jgi:hypothetical protein